MPRTVGHSAERYRLLLPRAMQHVATRYQLTMGRIHRETKGLDCDRRQFVGRDCGQADLVYEGSLAPRAMLVNAIFARSLADGRQVRRACRIGLAVWRSKTNMLVSNHRRVAEL